VGWNGKKCPEIRQSCTTELCKSVLYLSQSVGLPNAATRRLCLLVLPRRNDARHTAAGYPGQPYNHFDVQAATLTFQLSHPPTLKEGAVGGYTDKKEN
jgi:hypothetical protein